MKAIYILFLQATTIIMKAMFAVCLICWCICMAFNAIGIDGYDNHMMSFAILTLVCGVMETWLSYEWHHEKEN